MRNVNAAKKKPQNNPNITEIINFFDSEIAMFNDLKP